jgi:hypothetical protein
MVAMNMGMPANVILNVLMNMYSAMMENSGAIIAEQQRVHMVAIHI